jgi:hypothetical protein
MVFTFTPQEPVNGRRCGRFFVFRVCDLWIGG